MSMVTRARNSVQGDTIVNNGDVIITNAANGVVMTDNAGEKDRITVYDNDGVKTIEVTKIP